MYTCAVIVSVNVGHSQWTNTNHVTLWMMMEGIFNYYSFLLTIPNVAAIPFLSYTFVLIIINVSSCLQYFRVYMLHISTHILSWTLWLWTWNYVHGLILLHGGNHLYMLAIFNSSVETLFCEFCRIFILITRRWQILE